MSVAMIDKTEHVGRVTLLHEEPAITFRHWSGAPFDVVMTEMNDTGGEYDQKLWASLRQIVNTYSGYASEVAVLTHNRYAHHHAMRMEWLGYRIDALSPVQYRSYLHLLIEATTWPISTDTVSQPRVINLKYAQHDVEHEEEVARVVPPNWNLSPAPVEFWRRMIEVSARKELRVCIPNDPYGNITVGAILAGASRIVTCTRGITAATVAARVRYWQEESSIQSKQRVRQLTITEEAA